MLSRISPVFRLRMAPLSNKMLSLFPLIPRFAFSMPLFPQRTSTPFSSLSISYRSFTMPFSSYPFRVIQEIKYKSIKIPFKTRVSTAYEQKHFLSIPVLTNSLKAILQAYYQKKDKLQGLIIDRSQPIADINLSIIEERKLPWVSKKRKNDKKDDKKVEEKEPLNENKNIFRADQNIIITKTVHSFEETSVNEKALAYYEELHNVRHPIDPADIFEKHPGTTEAKSVKRLLILGAAGVGKTTLSQYLAYQWGTGKLWSTKFDYVFWIPLRQLIRGKEEQLTLSALIHRECFESNKDIRNFDIEQIICEKNGRTLILLDGYDEVAHLLEAAVDCPAAAVLKEAIQSEYLILTSRPHQLHKLALFNFDRRLENTGFTDDNIVAYINRYFKTLMPPQISSGERALSFIKRNPSIWGTAHIPINLALICDLWQNEEQWGKSSFTEQLGMTGLYRMITHHLLKRYYEKKGISTRDRGINWMLKQCYLELEFLGRLAYAGLQAYEVNLTPNLQLKVLEIMDIKHKKNGNSPFHDVLQAGFLRSIGDNTPEEINKPHYFIHFTFQEFLAAYYLVNNLGQNSDSEDYHAVVHFLSNEKYNPRYQVVFGFMSGLLCIDKVSDTLSIQKFWDILLDSPFDLSCVSHGRLIIRCLEEAGDNYIPYRDILFNQVYQWLNSMIRDDADAIIINLLTSSLQRAPKLLKEMKIIEKLLDILENNDEWSRANAASVLGRLGTTAATSEVMKALLQTQHDKKDYVRKNGLEALVQLFPPTIFSEVKKALLRATETYEGYGYGIKKMAKESLNNYNLRINSKDSLSSYNDLSKVTTGYSEIKDPDERIIKRAEELVYIDQTTIIPEIIKFLLETPRNKLTSKILKILNFILSKQEDKCRMINYVVKSFIEHGSDAATLEIIKIFPIVFDDEREWVRQNAIEIFNHLLDQSAMIDNSKIINILFNALDKENVEIKRKVANVLDKLNISFKHLELLKTPTLQTLISIGCDLKATPLSALISAYFVTYEYPWLRLISRRALYQGVSIVITKKTVAMYEGAGRVSLPLPAGKEYFFVKNLCDFFSNQAHYYKLPFPLKELKLMLSSFKVPSKNNILPSVREALMTASTMKIITVGRTLIPAEQLDYLFYLQEKAFLNCLKEKIVSYVKQLNPKNPKPKCFVSYAWGEPYYEYKVECLVHHLEQAGFEMLFDRWEDRRGKELTEFVGKLTKADFILVIGTELYLKKYERCVENYDDREHVVRLEARLINHLVSYSTKHSDKVITLLFESTPEKCFPPLLHPKLACDFIHHDYFNELLKLIHDLHGISNRDSAFQILVDEFKREASALAANISPEKKETYRKEKIDEFLKKEAEEDRKAKATILAEVENRASPAAREAPHATFFKASSSTSSSDTSSQTSVPNRVSTPAKKMT